jgi:uncharacterized membrane protein SirB2
MSNLSIFVSMAVYMLFLFLFLEYTREKQGFYKWFSIIALLNDSIVVLEFKLMVSLGQNN